MGEWISIKDSLPPKNQPFLASTPNQIAILEWKEKIFEGGWYGYYCPCKCCKGFCLDKFEYWMPLPKPAEMNGSFVSKKTMFMV